MGHRRRPGWLAHDATARRAALLVHPAAAWWTRWHKRSKQGAANRAPMPSHEAYVAAGLLLPAPWRSSAPVKCQDQDPPTAGSDVPMRCHGQRSRPYNLGHLEPILPVTLHPPHNASSDFPHLAFHGGSVHIRPIEHALVYSATALCCADTRPLHRAL